MSHRSWFLTLAFALPLAFSCNNSLSGGGGDDPDGGENPNGCVNLQCKIVNCTAMGQPSTTVTGVVNIPAGNLPLYNATVYIPNSAVAPIVSGASCDRCGDVYSGDPVATATTDVNGRFTLKDVPVGSNIPLVIRLGKWRRQITIPAVTQCTENQVAAVETRLPRNKSEGDIPKIALTTGGYDAIECLLRKIGIDDSEFTPESDTGRVNLFAGHGGSNQYKPGFNGGAALTNATTWWDSLDNMKKYDILVLSCEGTQYLNEKSANARQALLDYINMGGRVFASHWHNVWLSDGPAPLNTVLTLGPSQNFTNPITADINTSFAKGGALADWLVNVQASQIRGKLQILNARNSVASINAAIAQRFVSYNDTGRGAIDEQYFSFFAPIGAPASMQCGRMVFTDMHVSGNDANSPNPALDQSTPAFPFPNGCVTNALSPQEKALLFLLFDLTNCVQPQVG